MGGARSIALLTDNNETVDWLDTQEWYTYTGLFIDALSLAGVVGAAATSIKTVIAVKKASYGKSVMEVLKGISRQERKKLAEEIARMQIPGISNKALKAMTRSGAIPKRYTQVKINKELKSQIVTLFGSSASILGSGLSGIINNASSKVSVLFVQEMITE